MMIRRGIIRQVRRIHGTSRHDTSMKENITRGTKVDLKVAAGLPDFVEKWNPERFYQVGIGGGVASVGLFALMGPLSVLPWVVSAPVSLYWYVGLIDMAQKDQTIRRNFPVLARVRYVLESLRPEIRQYLIESDHEAAPFPRDDRSVAYQRAKGAIDTQPFGTRMDVYKEGYEWINHSIWPTVVPPENQRVLIGGPNCKKKYSASLLNVSAMSYGALSDNAVLALNSAAKLGNFYHNTGEGGVSEFHKRPGGDLVWNIGTGYFGCRNPKDGTFSVERFRETIVNNPTIKMVEIKISQGAKPAHGGMLPGAKVTKEIAEARGIPIGEDSNSPASHSAFSGPLELLSFIKLLREESDGLPIGFKLCIGRPREFTSIVAAMVQTGIAPDFITVDGAEGGTGAAPREFTNYVGHPLSDGLYIAHQTLVGAGLRDQVKIICSGKVTTGFGMVRNLALGADICNSARAMMFALGCIQALKCNTNKCPTGITTQDKALMRGLDVENKSTRVFQFQHRTVESCLELVGAAGVDSPDKLKAGHVMRRTSGGDYVRSYSELFPQLEPGALIKHQNKPIEEIFQDGELPRLQVSWNLGVQDLAKYSA